MSDVRGATMAGLDARTAYLLCKVRTDVFVVEQACPYPDLDGRDIEPDTLHLWVEENGVPIGVLRILADPGAARIGRLAVVRSRRGEGIGSALMAAALDRIGDRDSVLDAQAHLAGWYAQFGYEPSGPQFLEDDIPHIPMRRRACASPDLA